MGRFLSVRKRSRRPQVVSLADVVSDLPTPILAVLCSLLLLAGAVNATKHHRQRGNRSRRSRREETVDDRLDHAYYIIKNTWLLVLTPVIFVFLHSLLTDPIVPVLVRTLWRRGKRELTRHLTAGGDDHDDDGDDDDGDDDETEQRYDRGERYDVEKDRRRRRRRRRRM